jgi:ribonuclease HII
MPTLTLERKIGGIVCGLDEVGRGPLAGPVVAAAVIFHERVPRRLSREINDSKKLTVQQREALFPEVYAHAIVGVGAADVAEIDRLNILHASMLAMCRAFRALGRVPDHALIDGDRKPALPCGVTAVVGGDARSLSIAAASIVAKVHRDRLMAEFALAYPGYGWDHNAGYATPEHLDALERLGPTPVHRTFFAPVAQLRLALDGAHREAALVD